MSIAQTHFKCKQVFDGLEKIGTKITKENASDVVEIIKNIDTAKFEENVAKLKNEVWAHPRKAAQLTVDYIINKQKELKE